MAARSPQGDVYPLFEDFRRVESKVEAMDRKGIDTSVISLCEG